jgi:hypothetical protein
MKKLMYTALFSAIATTSAFAGSAKITEAEVLAAQKEWAQGIVEIGEAFKAKGEYKEKATQHINELYAYEQGEVLFKPTLASADQFRGTFDEALSYFVGGKIEEDKGFAIKPWTEVRFGEQEIITDSDSAIAMGNYFFTPDGSTEEVKVEYTFGYMKDDKGQLRINLHHSSLPYVEKTEASN